MGLDKLIKREISITIAVVLLVTTVFLMISYSIFTVDTTGEKNTITFGDISLRFCSNQKDISGNPQDAKCKPIENVGNVIGTKTDENGNTKNVPIYPRQDPVSAEDWTALTEDIPPYIFELENTGSLDLYVTMYLEKDTTAASIIRDAEDANGNKLDANGNIITGTDTPAHVTYNGQVDDNQIKIAIGETNATPSIKLYSDTVNSEGNHIIATKILIPAKTSKTFKLYAWLVSDAVNASQGKFFVTNISVKGEYLPSEILSN